MIDCLPTPGIDAGGLDAVFRSLFSAFGLVLYHYIAQLDSFGGLALIAEPNPVGSPDDLVRVQGRPPVSVSVLVKYLHYLYLRRFVDFSPPVIVLEVGGGAGFLAYVLKKMHSETKFLLIDVPEQLAVAHYFLDKSFPGKVLPYSEIVQQDIPLTSALFRERDIVLVPYAALGHLAVTATLGIGTATFQEMDRATVIAYMELLNRSILRSIYIYGGDGLKSHRTRSAHADLLELYTEHLPAFHLVDHGSSFLDPITSCFCFNPAYTPTFWQRRSGGDASLPSVAG